jgi:DNA-binding IclR family transcriptional regulator
MINQVLGPSPFLVILDLFLEHPEEFMNLREIARRTGKNPGSIARIVPRLVERGYITSTRIGSKVIAYQLNRQNEKMNLIVEFDERLKAMR